MSLRNRELVFLIPALVLTTLGFALVYTEKSSALSWSSLTYGALFLVLFVIAHLGRRILAPKADPYLLPVTALLSTLGIVLIYRINEDLALKQAMWLVAGLVAFLLVLALVRDLKRLYRYRLVVGILGLLLLLFTAAFGREINGARLWVDLGPISFQPAEFGKILLVIFFAAYLVDIREALTVSTRRVLGVPLPPFRYLAPLLTIWALSMALMIFMKDLGTSLLFFGALLALLYAATGRVFYVLVGLVLFFVGATVLYFIFPHVQTGWTSGSIPGRTRAARATRSSSRCSLWPRAACSGAAWARGTSSLHRGTPSSPTWRPTSSSRPSGRNWAWWGRWASSFST